MECKKCNWEWEIKIEDENPQLCHNCGFDSLKNEYDLIALSKWKSKLPFNETYKNGEIYRKFQKNVSQSELMWHLDEEDRIIESTNNSNWMIQFDNKLPIKIIKGEKIFIEKNKYHRLVKDKDNPSHLIIKVTKI